MRKKQKTSYFVVVVLLVVVSIKPTCESFNQLLNYNELSSIYPKWHT